MKNSEGGWPKRVISALRLIRKSSCTAVHSGFLICASLEITPFESPSFVSFRPGVCVIPTKGLCHSDRAEASGGICNFCVRSLGYARDDRVPGRQGMTAGNDATA